MPAVDLIDYSKPKIFENFNVICKLFIPLQPPANEYFYAKMVTPLFVAIVVAKMGGS